MDTHLVSEIHADLLQDVAGNLSEVHLVGFVLGELAWPGEHGLDGATGQGVVPPHDELVAVAGDEFDIHGLGPLASPVYLLPGVHAAVHHEKISIFCNRKFLLLTLSDIAKEEQSFFLFNFHNSMYICVPEELYDMYGYIMKIVFEKGIQTFYIFTLPSFLFPCSVYFCLYDVVSEW